MRKTMWEIKGCKPVTNIINYVAKSFKSILTLYILCKKRRTPNNRKYLKRLYSYITGTFSNIGSYLIELYANPDHIHILCTLPRTITIADLISKVKSASSKWMKTKGVPRFSWQNGYGVFSVSSSKVETVRNYILNQKEHHKKASFKDEYRKFLKEYKIEYDERYVWE